MSLFNGQIEVLHKKIVQWDHFWVKSSATQTVSFRNMYIFEITSFLKLLLFDHKSSHDGLGGKARMCFERQWVF